MILYPFPSDFNQREQDSQTPVHIINIEVQDNHDEATLGAFLIYELCQLVSMGKFRTRQGPTAPIDYGLTRLDTLRIAEGTPKAM